MGELTGRTAVVTGANRGVGRGIAVALASRGADLAIAARGEETLRAVAAEIAPLGVNVLAVPTDVTSESSVENLFARVAEQFGRLDLLINNAGAFDGEPLDEMSLASWDEVISVNLRGPFLCTRAALRMMKPRNAGRIINIGSISAHRVRPRTAAYSTSKAGLWGLTQVTALEGRDYGVTCCCLHPGNILVERRRTDRRVDAEPMMSVEEIADVVAFIAALPPHIAMLESVVLPRDQLYVGRG